jgi:light-regulated signal transduction histidine kinase (bacteriophytochrome)
MNSQPDPELAYEAGLRAYIKHPDESALEAAYELGRGALDNGAGVTTVVATHAKALGSILGADPTAAMSVRSISFLVECLAPLEMAHRGFMEANKALQSLNADLEQRVRERTRQLEEANEELGAFAYSVSHDLRAPVRSIHAFSQIILEDCAPMLDDVGRNALERIQVSTNRMGQLIDGILNLAQTSREQLSIGTVDLSAMAKEIVAELREQQPDRHIDVRIADHLLAQADTDLVRIALTNLLSNAFKFTANQPVARIDLASETQGDEVVYCMRDNGAGFDMTYVENVFRPFERLHSQEDFPGTGIGLATVHRAIRRHGGRIWAEASVDHGASFFFTLK